MSEINLDKLAKAYVRIRDARDAMRREYDEKDREFKDKLSILDAAILRHLNETGASSIKTPSGTVMRTERMLPNVQDWDALYAYIREEDAFDALERRVKVSFVKEYMDANDGAMPPGVSVHREYVAGVRRASSNAKATGEADGE